MLSLQRSSQDFGRKIEKSAQPLCYLSPAATAAPAAADSVAGSGSVTGR